VQFSKLIETLKPSEPKASGTSQTLVLIKPDALKNSLTGYILSQLSEFHTGLYLAAMKVVHVSKMLAEEHYAEHKGKIFFDPVVEYLMGKCHFTKQSKQRVIAIVYQGSDSVKTIRNLVGPTDPYKAREVAPGCIRALGAVVPVTNEKNETINRIDNLIHASAKDDEAEREIKLWFKPDEIPAEMRLCNTIISDITLYYADNKVTTEYSPNANSLIAVGNMVWESDFIALDAYLRGKPSTVPLDTIIAKYILNY
jgi:nucleoside-diphosphate kinase